VIELIHFYQIHDELTRTSRLIHFNIPNQKALNNIIPFK